MSRLGILLAWAALQTTLLALAAAAAYLIAGRRKPAVAAAVAACGPCGAVLLTLLALSPLPSWWNWQSTQITGPSKAEVTGADVPPAEPASPKAEKAAHASSSGVGGAGWLLPISLSRWTWEGAARAAAHITNQPENRWAILVIVFLSGAALCVLRLMFGVWAVSDLRRRSRPVADPSIGLLIDQLRGEMGYRRRIEVRESPGVCAPAVVGWLRPLVLLPVDWRDWSDSELRAVCAHELAHIGRSDYLLGLLTCLGVALHFYNPLLHWLSGRLRLQQELAADALAAPLAGGRPAYLFALAGLALRLEDRRSAGWPANPLFSRGTLLRRIQMLKTKDGRFGKPVSRWSRALIVGLLAVAVLGVSALRCPAQKEEAKPASERVNGAEKPSKDAATPAPEEEPFNLSFLAPDAMGIVAVRPSAVLCRPGLKKYADEANKGVAALCKLYGLSRAFGLPIQDIDQVSATIRIGTDKTTEGTRNNLMLQTPFVIRSVKPFDWSKELKELIPGVTEARHGGKVVYKFPTDGPIALFFGPKKACCFIADGRTIVFDADEDVDRLIARKPGDAPAWAADLKRVERGVLALVLDNRNGACGKELAARDKSIEAVAAFHLHTSWIVAGVSADKDFVCDAVAHFDGEETAGKAEKVIKEGLATARDLLAKPETLLTTLDDNSIDRDDAKWSRDAQLSTLQFFQALIHEPQLNRDGPSIRLRCRAKCDTTQVLRAIIEGEIGL